MACSRAIPFSAFSPPCRRPIPPIPGWRDEGLCHSGGDAFADTDWSNFDPAAEREREAEHRDALQTWLNHAGHNGPHTGRVLKMPVADGQALYMFMDSGENSALIHLPYGEAYQSREVGRMTREEVLGRLDLQDRLRASFEREAQVPEGPETDRPSGL